MSYEIKKVAVLGAGTMGGGIAAHCANAGLEVVLLDLAPSELTAEEHASGLTLESKLVRNRVVSAGFERLKQARPAALFTPETADRISIGNFSDDMGLIADADWIVEAIVEQLGPKQELMAHVEALRKPGSIVSSNTSGIPIAAIAEGRSEEFRQHFLGTHFFNPPRYLALLELIPAADTLAEVTQAISRCADLKLGKGVVLAKDRPNFIANRIFTYAGQLIVNYALEHGYSVEEVDNLTGELIGYPKTATFRLLDLVGLDVMLHVMRNLYQAVPDDEERNMFRIPAALEEIAKRGWIGNKAGQGFYKQQRGASGKQFWALNLRTLEYQPPTKVRFDLVGKARKIENLRERLRFLIDNADLDRAGVLLRDVLLRVLAYAARRVPEISDSLADIDRALRLGLGHKLGPFEIWDALGVRAAVERMRERDIAVAPWVEELLDQGNESFYRSENGRVTDAYDPASHAYVAFERPEGVIVLDDLRAQGKELARNESASILDLDDGVLCLEFHAKMNAIDPLIAQMGQQALALLEDDRWAGLVIGNQGTDFSAGVNLMLLAMALAGGQLEQVREFAKGTQDLFYAIRRSSKPVVAAPHGRVLGGGVEIALAAAQRVAAAETYMGLVELGVGLVPSWGGCKEFMRRQISPHMHTPYADPLPYFRQAFETIALAKVGESAEHSRQLGYLDQHDKIVPNKERLIAEAKQSVIELAATGYTPVPSQGEPVYAMGRRGIAAMGSYLHQMRVGGYISAYDQQLAEALAWVLSGGDLSQGQWVTEQYILDLELEQIMRLALEPKTQERIMGMLQTGKPVRN